MITRGIKHAVDQFITELQGKYMPMKARAADDKELKDFMVQMMVRPIQLWECVFPEECKDIALSTLLSQKLPKDGMTQHKKHNKFLWAIRKALGAEPVPEYDNKIKMPISSDWVEVVGIGVKKDYWIDMDGKHHPNKVEGSFEGL